MIKIRKIRINEWQKVRKEVMYIEHNTFEKELWYVEEDGDYDSFKFEGSINLMIFDNNKIIGYLMSSKIEDDVRCKKDKHYGMNDSIYLDSVAILPLYQGKGLGKKLFKKFLGLASRKYSRVILDATSESMIKLADSEGFKKIKYFKKWEGSRPSWFMEKIIK